MRLWQVYILPIVLSISDGGQVLAAVNAELRRVGISF